MLSVKSGTNRQIFSSFVLVKILLFIDFSFSICQSSHIELFFFSLSKIFSPLPPSSFLTRSYTWYYVFLLFSSPLFSSLLHSSPFFLVLFLSFPFFSALITLFSYSFVCSHLLRTGMPLAISVALQSFSGSRPIQHIFLGYRLYWYRWGKSSHFYSLFDVIGIVQIVEP